MTKNAVSRVLIALLFFSTGIPGQNEMKEHPALSKYRESEFMGSRVKDYAPYVLGIGLEEEKDEEFRGHRHYFSQYIDLEGKVTRIQYRVPRSEGLFKVFKNYEKALKEAGCEILFTTSEKESDHGFWSDVVYHHEWGINAIRIEEFTDPTGGDGFRYIAAAGSFQDKNIYFAIYINNRWDDHIYITQDVIEVNPMESGLVSAEKMADQIEMNGFVPIYGIHFDTAKWNIKAESEPALKEIAAFLKNHPEETFFIVGHTDNQGDFQSNLLLSEKRAREVMKALVRDYAVPKDRVEAHGVASLCPVASNATPDGRARNRRVVIVKR